MRKYIPVLLVVLLVVSALAGLKRLRNSTNETPIAPLTTTLAPTGDGSPETPPVETSGTVSRSTSITLTVSAPADNTTVTSSNLVVRGKTVAGAEVFINDAETKADGNGNFSATITLDEGENYILVVANDAAGNYSEKEITVVYEAQ